MHLSVLTRTMGKTNKMELTVAVEIKKKMATGPISLFKMEYLPFKISKPTWVLSVPGSQLVLLSTVAAAAALVVAVERSLCHAQ